MSLDKKDSKKVIVRRMTSTDISNAIATAFAKSVAQ